MLYSIDHAVGVARDFADRLTMRMKGSATINTVRQTQDEWGYPIVIMSHNATETEGNAVIWVRFTNLFEESGSPETSPAGAPIDIFGNATLPFTPTIGQVAYELTSGGAPEPTTGDYSTVLFEMARTGCVIQQYAQPNGTAVTEASITSGNLVQELKDIDWRYLGNT